MIQGRDEEIATPGLTALINDRITRRETELAQVREVMRSEQAQRVASEKEMISLQEQLKFQQHLLEQQRTDFAQEITDKEGLIKDLDQAALRQRDEVAALRQKLAEMTLAVRAATEQSELLNKRVIQGEAALAKAQSEARSEIVRSEESRSRLEQVIVEKNQQLQTTEAKLQSAQQNEEALRVKLDEANLKYRAVTEQIAQLKEELAQGKKEQQASKEALARTSEELKTAQTAEQAGQQQIEQLRVQLLQSKKAANDANAQIERLRQQKLTAENQVAKTRATVSFQLGYLLIHCFKSFKAFKSLPSQLLALRRESKRRKDEKKKSETLISSFPAAAGGALAPAVAPAAELPVAPRPAAAVVPTLPAFADFSAALKQLKVACIMDEFTCSSFMPECNLQQLTPQHWQQELTGFAPELLFIESAWRGKDELWGNKVGHRSDEVVGIIDWCRTRQIPTVFWNKEDPVHFETFLGTANLFDYVFTTDIDCIHRYKAALGHERVYLLPFACQPATTNPLEIHERKDAFCFAGAYYVRYPERTRDLGNLLSTLATLRPVEIFDRNQGKNDPNYQFPAEFRSFIVGHLPFDQIDRAYKGYRYALNLNSIKQSQSMFARRVFDLLASNTVTISNFSRGVRLFFGDLVLTSDDGDEIARRFETLCRDESTQRKFRLAGLRKVMQEHTCQDRLAYLVAKVQGGTKPSLLPRIAVTGFAENRQQFDTLLEHFARQNYAFKRLLIVVPPGFAPENVANDAAIRILTAGADDAATIGALLDPSEFIAGIVVADYYGPNYLLDLALASRYSTAEAIGKVTHYLWSDTSGLSVVGEGQQYRLATRVAARAALVRGDLIRELSLRDWCSSLLTRRIEAAEVLGIDEFNYCQAGNTPEFLASHSAAVNDLVGLDSGLAMDELCRDAETIAPAAAEEGDGAPVLSGAKLATYFKPPTGKGYQLTVSGSTWEVESTLADGTHDYLYAATDLRPADLGYEGQVQFHFDVTPGLSLQLAMLFLDAQKQRISSVVKTSNSNQSAEIPAGTEWIRLGLRFYGSGTGRINGLVLGHRSLKPAVIIGRARHLVLTNQYPAYDDLYRNSFVHSRVAAYGERGERVDVFRLRSAEPLAFQEFHNVDVISGSPEALHKLLLGGHYQSVLVHFLDEVMWQVLQQHIESTQVFVWVHGAEIQPWHRRDYNYETEEQRDIAKLRSEARMTFWRSLLQPPPANLKLIFVSEYFAEEVMEDLGFRLPAAQYTIIHNPIDTELFAYSEKSPEQRKKILSIRPYASRKYANDLSVQAILSLSKQAWFNDLEFRMIGDGELFDTTLAPLRAFKNVIIEQRFLNHAEIAALHRGYGLFLCPTRMDAQGVSRDEAMSSGLVPVTNRVAAIPEFVDASCGILAEAEDAEGLADGIAELYTHPEKFLDMSRAAGLRVRNQSSSERMTRKELELFSPVTSDARRSVPKMTFSTTETTLQQPPAASTIQSFLSIDVEALPGRAGGDPFETLIWGRVGGEEFGIRRICNILRQHQIKGNFMVDLSATLLYGDAPVQQVVDYLLAEGHEVHTHLHSEWVVRKWGLEQHLGANFYGAFDKIDYELARRLLDFSAWKYRKLTGKDATVFRPGGLYFTRQTLLAAKDAGFTTSSSLYLPRGITIDPNPPILLAEPFLWDNGLAEIPVDFFPEPLDSPIGEFSGAYQQVLGKTNKTFNLVIHSWTLAKRDEQGFHPAFTPAHEERLHKICSHIKSVGAVSGYDEYLAHHPPTKTFATELCISSPSSVVDGDVVACSICGALIATDVINDERCPACGSRFGTQEERTPDSSLATSAPLADPQTNSNDYLFEDVRHEDRARIEQEHLPAPVLPIRYLEDQQFRILKISHRETCGYVPYIVDVPKLHVQLQRSFLPCPEIADKTVAHLFQMNPACNIIQIGNCYTAFDGVPGVQRVVNSKTFLLDLPDSFETYRRERISVNLRKDLERDERRLQKAVTNFVFEIISGDSLPFDRFCNIVEVISRRLKEKNGASNRTWEDPYTEEWFRTEYPTYRDKGFSAVISADGVPIAVALVARTGVEYHYMASGYEDAYDSYSIGKVLLYRLIEKIIENGGKYLHLGGGDFGYKTRFGAREVPLYNIEIHRPGSAGTRDLELLIKHELARGVSITEINRMVGRDAEVVLGQEKFEAITGVDFIAPVGHEELDIDNECCQYQVTIKDAFVQMLKHVPDTAGSVFLDVGCGKGMMLYFATRFGFRKYMGLDISPTLINIARENFRKLNLVFDHELIVEDVRNIDPMRLNEVNVIYLYNPFSAGILESFLQILKKSQILAPRTVWLVYCNARYPELLPQYGFSTVKEFLPRSEEWRFSDYSAIYRSQQ